MDVGLRAQKASSEGVDTEFVRRITAHEATFLGRFSMVLDCGRSFGFRLALSQSAKTRQSKHSPPIILARHFADGLFNWITLMPKSKNHKGLLNTRISKSGKIRHRVAGRKTRSGKGGKKLRQYRREGFMSSAEGRFALASPAPTNPPASTGEAIVVTHDELRLDLCHCIHGHADNDEERGAAKEEGQTETLG